VRSCGAGPISTNYSCVVASAAFNTIETSGASVYEFDKLDPQDGRLHTVMVKYAPYEMKVFGDNMLEPRMRFDLRMQDAVKPSPQKTAFVGFCGSTGDAISSLQVLSFRFTALEQEGSLYTWGHGTYAQVPITRDAFPLRAA